MKSVGGAQRSLRQAQEELFRPAVDVARQLDAVVHAVVESPEDGMLKAPRGLPRTVGIKLNDKDISRAKELLKYRWFQKKPWQEEIKRMLASGLKYELDALANKDFRYLTKTYLPRKLKEEDWLD